MGPMGWQVMGLSKRVPSLSVCCGPFFGVQPKRQLVPKQCHLEVHPRVARGTEKIIKSGRGRDRASKQVQQPGNQLHSSVSTREWKTGRPMGKDAQRR